MTIPRDPSLFASLRDIRDVVESKLRAVAGDSAADDFPRLRALELALEELNVLWEELKGQSDQLSAERKRYADLFDFAPDAYLATDPHGMVIESNRAATELLGIAHERLLGKPMATFIAMSHRAHYRQRLVGMIAEGGMTRQVWRSVLLPRNAAELPVELCVAGLRDPRSSTRCLCWLLRPAARAAAEA